MPINNERLSEHVMQRSLCFIKDLYAGDTLEMQHAPKQINDRRSAVVRSVPIPGFSTPRIGANASGDRTISFDLSFYAVDRKTKNTDWVKRQVNWIASLSCPRVVHEATGRKRITPVLLNLGRLFSLPVIIRDMNVVWGSFTTEELHPRVAMVSLSFVEAQGSDILDALSVRSGGNLLSSWDPVPPADPAVGVDPDWDPAWDELEPYYQIENDDLQLEDLGELPFSPEPGEEFEPDFEWSDAYRGL